MTDASQGTNDSSDLPEGWTTCSLRELLSGAIGGEWGLPPEKADGKSLIEAAVIRGTEFRAWDRDKGATAARRAIPAKKLESRRLQEGDLVLEVSGGGPQQPVGRTILIDRETLNDSSLPLTCSNFCRRLQLSSELSPAFVWWGLRALYARGEFDQYQTQTTNLRNLNVNDFLDGLYILVAPLAEQRRIVAKVEELLARVNAARERLAKVPAILKRFRQSILAAAGSGQLTADWRGDATAPSDVEELPPSWRSVTVGDVIDGLKYGTSKKCDYQKNGVPVLRIPNIGEGVVLHDDLKYAHLDDGELEQLGLQTGDVLMIRSNGSVSLLGKTAIVHETERGFAYAGYLIRLRPDRAKIDPQFLNSLLGSYGVRLQIELPARSTSGVNNINSEEVRSLALSLPPLAEQTEIVRRVEALFALADKIEARVQGATARVEKITQAILAKAFRGELVPTEAELARRESRPYEPASALLERIRAQRAAAEPNGKPRHRTKATAPRAGAASPTAKASTRGKTRKAPAMKAKRKRSKSR